MDLKNEQTMQSGEVEHEQKHESLRGGTALPVGRSPGAFAFCSPFGPRIMFSPDGVDGAGGGAADTGNAGSEGGEGGAENAGGEGGNEPPVRPDYIPENFWDAEKGFKADDLNSLVAFKAEHDANLAQVPEKPDGYKVTLPKDFQLPDGFELPEGQDSLIDENDPRISAARDFAHANQMSQSQFEGLVALGAQMDIAEQTELKTALAKQRDLLGGKAPERINAVTQWLGAKLGGEFANALVPMMYTAQQIEAFEALMRLNRGAVPGNAGAGRESGKTEISDEEWNKMSNSDRINWSRQNSKK